MMWLRTNHKFLQKYTSLQNCFPIYRLTPGESFRAYLWKRDQAVKLSWRWLNIWQHLWVKYQWTKRKLTQVAFHQVWLSLGAFVPLPLLHPTPRAHVTSMTLKLILPGSNFQRKMFYVTEKQCRLDPYDTCCTRSTYLCIILCNLTDL
jgi:hypothetical protein